MTLKKNIASVFIAALLACHACASTPATNVNAAEKPADALLWKAVTESDVEGVRSALGQGASPNTANNRHDITKACSALCLAVSLNPKKTGKEIEQLAIVDALLKAGAEPDWFGCTQGFGAPLKMAEIMGNAGVVGVLLKHKASPYVGYPNGTIVDFAEKDNFPEIAKMIRKAGGFSTAEFGKRCTNIRIGQDAKGVLKTMKVNPIFRMFVNKAPAENGTLPEGSFAGSEKTDEIKKMKSGLFIDPAKLDAYELWHFGPYGTDAARCEVHFIAGKVKDAKIPGSK